MSPLNAAICTTTYLERQKSYDPGNKILFKKQLFDLEVKVTQRSLRYATHHLMVMHPHTKYHWSISKDKNVMAQTRKYYLKNNYLTLRSKVKVPCRTHIPNIIDLYGKTKKLWSGQALLRRNRRSESGSGRKNQTKRICLPSFEGET